MFRWFINLFRSKKLTTELKKKKEILRVRKSAKKDYVYFEDGSLVIMDTLMDAIESSSSSHNNGFSGFGGGETGGGGAGGSFTHTDTPSHSCSSHSCTSHSCSSSSCSSSSCGSSCSSCSS